MDEGLRAAIGLADACELMSRTWAFPDEDLASALADGSLSADAQSCLLDAGCAADAAERAASALAAFADRDVAELLGAMRKGHSVLYLTPGTDVPVWPYEAAFRLREGGSASLPSLFRSQTTVDVERHMKEAGVLPKDARTEPSDSVWNELSFVSYLYGNVAKALHEGREADAEEWSGRVVRFWDEHAAKWLPAFMERTIEESSKHGYGAEYAALAELGLLVLDAIRGDVESRKVEA